MTEGRQLTVLLRNFGLGVRSEATVRLCGPSPEMSTHCLRASGRETRGEGRWSSGPWFWMGAMMAQVVGSAPCTDNKLFSRFISVGLCCAWPGILTAGLNLSFRLNPTEWVGVVAPISQVRKLRLKEGQLLSWGHTASKRLSWVWIFESRRVTRHNSQRPAQDENVLHSVTYRAGVRVQWSGVRGSNPASATHPPVGPALCLSFPIWKVEIRSTPPSWGCWDFKWDDP